MSVLLPLPETPVTATKHPSGISTSMSRRLCSRAPRTVMASPEGCRLRAGTGIDRLPEMYDPVTESFTFSMPVTGPL